MSEQLNKPILADGKLAIGLNPDEPDEFFDQLIIDEINNAIGRLAQLGLLKVGDFIVSYDTEVWSDYLGTDNAYLLPFVKSYIQKKVKLNVDPPQSGTLCSALEQELDKLEFNIQTAIEMHDIEMKGGKL